jgi:hypothetical protein
VLVNAPFFQPPLQILHLPKLGGINGPFKSLAMDDPDSENDLGAVAAPRRIMDALVVRLDLTGEILVCAWKNLLRNPNQSLVNFKALFASGFGMFFFALMNSREVKFKTNLPFLMVDECIFRPDIPTNMKAFDKLSDVWRWRICGRHHFTCLPGWRLSGGDPYPVCNLALSFVR